MKRITMLFLILLLLVPSVALAQEPELGQITEPDNGSNFLDLGMWFFSLFALLAGWGPIVSVVIIDKGIKEVIMNILSRLPDRAGWQGAVRLALIFGSVVAGSWLAVYENDLNIFVSAPSQLTDMFTSGDAQSLITAGLLALSVFLTHNVKKWFAPEPATVTREAA